MAEEKTMLSIGKARSHIERLMRRLFDQDVSNIEYKTVSKSNNVYRVQTRSMGNLIVRVSHEKDRKDVFLKEEWCCSMARLRGIPAPNIITSGNLVIPYAYSISEEIKGKNADAFEGNKIRIWKQIGRYARKINSIDTRGYGIYFNWKSSHPMGFDSWKDYLFGYDIRIERVLSLYEEQLGRRLPKLESQIEKIKNWKVFPRLTHFDLVPANILVDSEGTITGILDWEYARSLPAPYGELSQMYSWMKAAGMEEELNAFTEGYGFLPEELEQVREEIEAYSLIRQANHFYWLLGRNDKEIERRKFIEAASKFSVLS